MSQKHTQHTARQGFTLIELSIVLVVIGLLVGGILVGKDMIRAAQVRATISQIEKLKSAVNTFKTKYNALPGDIIPSQASAFGFATRTGGTGDGDGDGFIEGCGQTYQIGSVNSALGCETVFFWTDLSAANLIAGSFTTTTDALITHLTSGPQFAPYLPHLPVGGSRSYLFVYGIANGDGPMPGPMNYIELLAVDSTNGIAALQNNSFHGNSFPLDPIDAWNIDTKMDDGLPCSGHVLGTAQRCSWRFCSQGGIIPGYQPTSG